MVDNPDLIFKDKDVYNIRLQIRQAQLGRLPPIEALTKNLEEKSDDFIAESLIEEEHLKAFLFATHDQIAFHHAYPDVLLLDSTYKTNRYAMPLLHFGAPTPCNTYFSTAFCFLSGEAEMIMSGRSRHSTRMSTFDFDKLAKLVPLSQDQREQKLPDWHTM